MPEYVPPTNPNLPTIEELVEKPQLFVELMDRFNIKPKDLGISSRYKLLLAKGQRKPSRELASKLLNLILGRAVVLGDRCRGSSAWRSAALVRRNDGTSYGTSSITIVPYQFHATPTHSVAQNPFMYLDINRELQEFLEYAKGKYRPTTYSKRIKVYANVVSLVSIPGLFARELNKSSDEIKRHVFKVLSAFASYLDAKYNTDQFTETVKRLRRALVKWYVPPKAKSITELVEDPEYVASRIINAIDNPKHRLFAVFMLATGLRTNCEAYEAFKNFDRYYRKVHILGGAAKIHLLELMSDRDTKRSYFTFITEKLAETLAETDRRVSLSRFRASWRAACAKVGYDHRKYEPYYLRRVHATLLRRELSQELVNLLQGRAPASVFEEHYNVESIKYMYDAYMKTVGLLVDKLLEGEAEQCVDALSS